MGCAGCWKCCILTCQNGQDTSETLRFAKCCRSTTVQFCKWIPVCLIWIILCWAYYVYVFLVCPALVELAGERVAYLVVFHVFLFLLMWSYARTIFTDVSRVPSEFHLTDDQLTEMQNEVRWSGRKIMQQNLASPYDFQTITKEGDPRYCDKCRCLKPDRCHHCSVCGKCILKMDHHCPWTNNCVGFYNYKFFLLTIVYTVLWCTFMVATTARFVAEIFKQKEVQLTYVYASIIILIFMCLVFIVANSSLLVYHLCLISHNTTTIETLFPPTYKTRGRATFSWGSRYNYTQIFGTNPLLWFLPVFTSLGDGVKFPVVIKEETDNNKKNNADDTPTEVVSE